MSSPRDGLCVSTAMALALAAFSTPALAGTFTVTTTSDDVTGGTLRQAILAANSNPGSDRIEFAIGTGAQTIIIRSNLPPITDTAVIDGTTQPGFAGVPLISIKGRNSTGTTEDSGLTIASSGCVVRGLNFQRFQLRSPGAGVVISGGSGSTDSSLNSGRTIAMCSTVIPSVKIPRQNRRMDAFSRSENEP